MISALHFNFVELLSMVWTLRAEVRLLDEHAYCIKVESAGQHLASRVDDLIALEDMSGAA